MPEASVRRDGTGSPEPTAGWLRNFFGILDAMNMVTGWTVAGVALVAGVAIGVGSAALEATLRPWRVGDFLAIDTPSDAEVPQVEAVETTHHFGSVGSGEKGQHAFVIRNRGTAPLVLTRGATSCTCTVSDLGASNDGGDETAAEKIVAPGGETTVSIQWTGKGAGGPFRQQATVLTNDPRRPEIAFVIEGTVVPTWRAVPDLITLPKLSTKSDAVVTTTVYTYGDEPPQVDSLAAIDDRTKSFFTISSAPLSAAELAQEPEATGGFTVSVALKPGLPIGPLRQTVRIVFRIPEEITAEIPIEGSVAGDISFAGQKWDAARQRLILGQVSSRAGLTTSLFITARGPDRELVKPVVEEVVPSSLVVEVGAAEPIGSGAVLRIPLTVVIPPGSPTANHLGSEQAPSGRIVLATGLPDSPTVSLPVSVVIGP
jgi:hypothetical protein